MPPRAKPKASQATNVPGNLGQDFLDDLATPSPKTTSSLSEDASRSLSGQGSRSTQEKGSSNSSEQGSSSKRQESRTSKHHVSLYISPDVDRQMKRIALDNEKKTWEIYHQALREYLDRKGISFDQLNAS